MNYWKEKMIEDEERGYIIPDDCKSVCASHFSNKYLREYINQHSKSGCCSYCGQQGKVIDMADLANYIFPRILEHYNLPDYEELPYEETYYDDDDNDIPGLKRGGGYAIPNYVEYYDTKELMGALDLVTDCEELDSDIENCFLWDNWIKRDALILSESEELSVEWSSFEDMVRHRRRFTFFKMPEFIDVLPHGDNGLYDILTELDERLSAWNLIKDLGVEQVFYRCRFLCEGETANSFETLTSPPDCKAKQSRMSPAGISMFYGNFDKKTAMMEVSPDGTICGGRYAVGKFKPRRVLKVMDLTVIPEYDFWRPGDIESLAFLNSFIWEITKKIKRDDRIHIEYVPSQVFTEYLRYIYKYDGKPIDGMIYESSLEGASGKNVVLFFDQKQSAEVLELVDV